MHGEIQIPEPEFGVATEIAILERLREHSAALIEQYIANRTRDGATFVSRDAAKMLFPEYMSDPTGNNRYCDKAASALAEAVRVQLLSKRPRMPRNQVVIVTGTPASGKSVSASEISGPTIEIIHETILTSLAKARERVEDAIAAGRIPQIIVVYTNDPRIHVRRMIGRARKIGRTVPLAYMAETYVGVPRMVQRLGEGFDGALKITCMNNSGAAEQVVFHGDVRRMLADLGRYTVESCLRVMDDELNQIDQSSPIPREILEEAKRRNGFS